MNEIQNFNTLGMCNEQNCSKPASWHELIKINKLWVSVCLCNEHMEHWERGKEKEDWEDDTC